MQVLQCLDPSGLTAEENELFHPGQPSNELERGAGGPLQTLLDQGEVHVAGRSAGYQTGDVLDRAGRRDILDASLLQPGLRGQAVDDRMVVLLRVTRQDADLHVREVRRADREGG